MTRSGNQNLVYRIFRTPVYITPVTVTEDRRMRKRMARIAGVDLPREKRIEIGLTYIYGIGRPTALLILEKAGINTDTRVKD